MKRTFRSTVAAVLAILMTLSAGTMLSGCGAQTPEPVGTPTPTEVPAPTDAPAPTEAPVKYDLTRAEPADWVICWYLCGSNLESFYGCASNDLSEAMAVKLPEGIRMVIETGGSFEWHNDEVSAGAIQRFVLDSNGLTKVDEQPAADMGEAETLSSFLTFCNDYYPGERSMLLFWNHGGGSVAGAAFDETYGYDALTLQEFSKAFADVYPAAEDHPFDIIGFDTCLMSTVDVAASFRNVADYLVASEELEPGCGWYYTGWLGALAEDPSMEPVELAKIICDTYAEECENQESHYEITLSVTDLNKVGKLTETYNSLGDEALLSALENPDFFAQLGREARQTENYGGNTREQGFTNMVDLGHLVQNCAELFPDTSADVLSALNDCVVYKINGPYRAKATGLSCYYSYDADIEDFANYTMVGSSESFKYLYAYGLTGKLSTAGMDYLSALGYDPQAKQASLAADIPYMQSVGTPQQLNLNPSRQTQSGVVNTAQPVSGTQTSAVAGSTGTVQSALQSSSVGGTTVSNGVQTLYDPALYPEGYGDPPNEDPSNGNDINLELYQALEAYREAQRQQEEERKARQAAEEAARQAAEEAARQAAEEAARQAAEEAARQAAAEEEMRRQLQAWRAQQEKEQRAREQEGSENGDDELLPHVYNLTDFDLSKAVNPSVSKEGYPMLKLDNKLADALSGVRVKIRQAVAVDSAPGRIDLVDWGESDLINTDWTNGTVYAWFGGYWAALDNVALLTEICYVSDDYILFSSPILLNGTVYNMHIAYVKTVTQLPGGGTQTDYEWHILGARQPLSPNGMPDKYLVHIRPGDEIIPLYRVMQDVSSPDAEWQYYYQEENAIIFEDESQLDLMTDFGPGAYELQFELIDHRGQIALSDSYYIQVTEYQVKTQLWKDYTAGRDNLIVRAR